MVTVASSIGGYLQFTRGHVGLGALAVIASAAATAPAAAQDNSFTGFRIEALTGYDNEGVDYDDDFFDGGKTSQSGIMYGLGAGYDFQMGTIVLGLEGEWMGSTTGKDRDYSGNRVNPLLIPPTTPVTANVNTDAGSDIYIGGRIGWVASPPLLIYGKIGYSHHEIDVDVTGSDNNVPFSFTDNIDVDGFRLGVGGEYQFSQSLYGKIEYRYTNYNNGELDVRGNVNLDPLFSGIDVVRHQGLVGVGLRF